MIAIPAPFTDLPAPLPAFHRHQSAPAWPPRRHPVTAPARMPASAEAQDVPRVLVIGASARRDGSRPDEVVRAWRIAHLAANALRRQGLQPDLVDLGGSGPEADCWPDALRTLDRLEPQRPVPRGEATRPGRQVTHAHGPDDAALAAHRADQALLALEPRWRSADGLLIVTPSRWHARSSLLKRWLESIAARRAAHAAARAMAQSAAGWRGPVPRADVPPVPSGDAPLIYDIVVAGDPAETEVPRHELAHWLEWLGLRPVREAFAAGYAVGRQGPSGLGIRPDDEAMLHNVRDAAMALALGLRRQGWPRSAA